MVSRIRKLRDNLSWRATLAERPNTRAGSHAGPENLKFSIPGGKLVMRIGRPSVLLSSKGRNFNSKYVPRFTPPFAESLL